MHETFLRLKMSSLLRQKLTQSELCHVLLLPESMQIFMFTHMITIGHGFPFTAGDVSSLASNLEQFNRKVKYAWPGQFAEFVRWSGVLGGPHGQGGQGGQGGQPM